MTTTQIEIKPAQSLQALQAKAAQDAADKAAAEELRRRRAQIAAYI